MRNLRSMIIVVVAALVLVFGAWAKVQAEPRETATSSVDLTLYAGWNLISLPLVPASTAITEALVSIVGSYDLIYAYDAADTVCPWKDYNTATPDFLNDLRQVNETRGLWIHTSQAATLVVTGSIPTATDIALKTGWNLVGYPSQVTRPVAQALAGIAGKYDLVYAYNAGSASPWKRYNPSAPPFLNTLKDMEPGWGYWIGAKENCTWSLP